MSEVSLATASQASIQSEYTSTGTERSGGECVSRVSRAKDGHGLTVNAGLEVLVACFAGEVADALLLVDLDGHGGLVVAKDALEGHGESFALGCVSGE